MGSPQLNTEQLPSILLDYMRGKGCIRPCQVQDSYQADRHRCRPLCASALAFIGFGELDTVCTCLLPDSQRWRCVRLSNAGALPLLCSLVPSVSSRCSYVLCVLPLPCMFNNYLYETFCILAWRLGEACCTSWTPPATMTWHAPPGDFMYC